MAETTTAVQTARTTQPTKVEKPVDKLNRFLGAESVKKQFENAVGKHSDTFIASVVSLFNADEKLQQCDAGALIKESLRAAVMNLPISKELGFGYIVPFNIAIKDENGNKIGSRLVPQFIIGYKGFIQLAQRTGQYKTLNADVVYEGELISTNKLTGEINLSGEKKSDKIVGYFAYFELMNGCRHTLYMSVHDMAVYAKKFSKGISYKTSVDMLENLANNPPAFAKVGWEGDFNAMGVKTCMRRLLSKYGFLSTEMQTQISSEIRSEADEEPFADKKDVAVDVAFEEVAVQDVNSETTEPDF